MQSIVSRKRPEWTKSRRKTEKDIEWLSRREYNPFLWKAWMLMGRSQFHKGAFEEAAATFAYMSRIYKGQPAIYGKARAWLAKCYIEQDWLYDAEDVIRNMQRDSLDWRAVKSGTIPMLIITCIQVSLRRLFLISKRLSSMKCVRAEGS